MIPPLVLYAIPVAVTCRTFGRARGWPSRLGQRPAADRILIDLDAQAGAGRYPQAPGGVGQHRFGPEEVAALRRPAGRVIVELDVRAASDTGHHVQVGHQAKAVGPGVRGEPALP